MHYRLFKYSSLITIIIIITILTKPTNGLSFSALSRNFSDEENSTLLPGMSARITQRGLDYGAKIGVEMLMLHIQNLTIPDVEETFLFTNKIKISGINITDFPQPDINVHLLENRKKSPFNKNKTSKVTVADPTNEDDSFFLGFDDDDIEMVEITTRPSTRRPTRTNSRRTTRHLNSNINSTRANRSQARKQEIQSSAATPGLLQALSTPVPRLRNSTRNRSRAQTTIILAKVTRRTNATRLRKKRSETADWYDEELNSEKSNAGFGGISVVVKNVSISLEAHVQITMSFLFYSSESEVDISIAARNVSINVTSFIGEKEGHFRIVSLECQAAGEIEPTFKGDMSDSLGKGYSLIQSFLKDFIFKKICDAVVNDGRASLEEQLSLSMNSVIESFPVLTLDYKLTQAPTFTQNYLETMHTGTFQTTNKTQEWTFAPEKIESPMDEDRMAYLSLTDYSLNTLWHSLLQGEYLKWTFNKSDMEKLASTASNFSWFQELNCSTPSCSDAISSFQKLGSLDYLEFDVWMNPLPLDVFKINGRTLSINGRVTAEIFLKTLLHRNKLLTVNMNLSCEAEVSLSNDQISYNITHFNASSDIAKAGWIVGLNDIDSSVVPLIRSIIERVGEEGIPLPSTPEFKLANATIVPTNSSGVLILGADFDFNPELVQLP